jgi:hypothetical protein
VLVVRDFAVVANLLDVLGFYSSEMRVGASVQEKFNALLF